MNKKIKIIMLAAEAAPLAKVGGLSDVIGSLPPAINKERGEARIIIPLYRTINKKTNQLKKLFVAGVKIRGRNKKISVWQGFLPKTKTIVYFLENKEFFGNRDIYDKSGNEKKFTFYSLAALEAIKKIGFQTDIIHCHDWHAAAVPAALKSFYRTDPFFKKVKTVYTIHNLAIQGITLPKIIKYYGLDENLPLLKKDLQNGDVNFMAQGIMGADIINTVSPTYAKEILSSPEGAGLENLLKKRKKDLYGILNGIDVDFFNPKEDKMIKKRYSANTLKDRVRNKLFLQKKLGLPSNKNIPLAGIVTRLVWQKGLELFSEKFADLDCQFVFLGTGEKKYEDYVKKLAKKYPKKISARINFDEKLAHEIYAGADIFLVPSRFEPCGLTQLIAMRYGAVPIVRATGGLNDTVNKNNGFKFRKFTEEDFLKTMKNALNIYLKNPEKWKGLQLKGMRSDFSWKKSAKKYIKLYQQALGA